MKIPRDLKPGDRLWYSKTEYAIVEPSWLCPSCYDHDSIRARRLGYESADVWYLMGGHQGGGTKKVIRIERIASAKPGKAKVDKDIAYCLKILGTAKHTHLWDDGTYDHNGGHSRTLHESAADKLERRIRAIAKRLNGGAL